MDFTKTVDERKKALALNFIKGARNGEKSAALALFSLYLEDYSEKHCGRVGSAWERVARSILSGKYCPSVSPRLHCDLTFVDADGKKHTAEVKTACGDIAFALRCQYIIYMQFPDVADDGRQWFDKFRVFTREEFSEMIDTYAGRGSLLKYDGDGERVHIQSFRSSGRPKASKPIADHINEWCEARPSYAEFFGHRPTLQRLFGEG